MATITYKQDQADQIKFWEIQRRAAIKKRDVKRVQYCHGMIDGLNYYAF